MSAAGPPQGAHCSASGGSAAAKRLSVGAMSSSRFQPWGCIATEPTQELARCEARNANRDHADDNLLIRAADIRVPDEEAESTARPDRSARAAARDHFGRDDDFPCDAHADRRSD